MTTTTVPVRLDFDSVSPTFAKALTHLGIAATTEADRAQIDPRLRELLRLRASQLNGCAYCVDMHTKDALAIGEEPERLAALPVWRETGFFSSAEQAALTFAESVTRMSETHVPAADYEVMAAEFSPDEIAAVLALVVSINAWNAVGVSTRAWEPGSYQP